MSIKKAWDNMEPKLNGTGFVKATGTSISYDNATYEPAFGFATYFDQAVKTTSSPVFAGLTLGTTTTGAALRLYGTTASHYLQSDSRIIMSAVARHPAFTVALAGAGAGNVDNGTHTYYVSYTTAKGKTELSIADGSTTFGGTAGPTVTVTDKTTNGKVNVNVTASTDYRVTGICIYRTTGAFSSAKLVDVISNTTQTYVDNKSDADVVTYSAPITDYRLQENVTNDQIYLSSQKAMFIGVGNTILGANSGSAITVGGKNTIIGAQAATALSTGGSNTLIGYGAGGTPFNGDNSVGVGLWALYKATGAGNVAIGVDALFSTSSGSNNTALGYYAGYSNTTTGQSIFIGAYAGYRQTTANVLVVDSISSARAAATDERDNAIVYGTGLGTLANQTLRLNAKVGINFTPTVAGLTFGSAENITKDTNDLTITCATDKTVVFAPVVYDDLNVSIYNIKPGSTAPDTSATYAHGIAGGIAFPVIGFGVNEEMFFDVQTSHSMKLSTVLEQHIHFILPNTTNIGDKFKFQLDVIAAPIGSAWAVPTGSPFTKEYTVATNDNTYHRLLSVCDIPAVNTTVSTVYKCRLKRIAASANEYGSDVYIDFSDCHYQKDTVGSRQQTAK